MRLATVLSNFARVLQSHGDHDQALALFEQSLDLLLERRPPPETARCLVGLAGAAVGCGDVRRAAQAIGAAEHVLDSSGIQLAAEDQLARDAALIGVRAVLDDDSLDAERQRGRATVTQTRHPGDEA